MDGFADGASLTFVQGAHFEPNASEPSGWDCQHGPLECEANAFFACGFDYASKKPLEVGRRRQQRPRLE